jgi:hypothetical protein
LLHPGWNSALQFGISLNKPDYIGQVFLPFAPAALFVTISPDLNASLSREMIHVPSQQIIFISKNNNFG